MTGTEFEIGVGSAAADPFDLVRDICGRVSTTIMAAGRSPIADARVPGALVLRAVDTESEVDTFSIAVVDRAGKALLNLGPFGDEDAVAIWRSLSASSGLPMLMVGLDGHVSQPFQQIGRLQLGPVRIRRGKAVLSGRRPRFLVRRKTARLPRRPLVYREREIAGGSPR
jgi:hypothetical protein